MNSVILKSLCAAFIMLSAFGPAALAYDFKVGSIYYGLSNDRKSAYVTYANLGQGDYSGYVRVPYEVNWQMQSIPVKKIGDFAFINSQRVDSVHIAEGVTSIGQQAFSHCYFMQSVSLPSTVRSLLDYAFEYCEDMTSFRIPASLSQINEGVFYDCKSLRGFTIDESNTFFMVADDALYTADMKEFVQYPCGKPGSSFTVADGTTTLRPYSFSCCRLEWAVLPESLTAVGDYAFIEATALRHIVCLADTPPACSEEVFEPTVASTATLYVKPEAMQAYRDATGWGSFAKIVAFDADGVEGIGADERTDGAVYSISGMKVANSKENIENLPAGIYFTEGKPFIKK